MGKLYGACLCLLAAGVAVASPADDVIVLPTPQVVPNVMPPGVVTRLNKGERYVFQAKVPCDIQTVPNGVVSWVEKAGPREWTAVFAGGKGVEEDRSFDGPLIYALAPLKSGSVEVFVLPKKGEGGWKRFTLDVDAGEGPIPPPKPPTPPDPPVPPVPVPVSSFRVIWVVESASTPPPGQNSVVNAKAVRDYLTRNTTPEDGWAGWRSCDPNSDLSKDQKAMAAMWAAVLPKVTVVPSVAIEINGKVDILNLPATPEAALALFTKYSGK